VPPWDDGVVSDWERERMAAEMLGYRAPASASFFEVAELLADALNEVESNRRRVRCIADLPPGPWLDLTAASPDDDVADFIVLEDDCGVATVLRPSPARAWTVELGVVMPKRERPLRRQHEKTSAPREPRRRTKDL
jgi:hypothetical protein